MPSVSESTDTQSKPKKGKAKRTRLFCCITYIDVNALDSFLKSAPWVQHWCYITHDKDLKKDGTLKEIHTHFLLYTFEAKTSSAVKKIFDRFSAEYYSVLGGSPQNTDTQCCNDITVQYRYLRHADDPDKYQYDISLVHHDNIEYWSKVEKTNGLSCHSYNNALAVFDDYISGVSTRDMIMRYGRDYVVHINQYKVVALDYEREQNKCGKNFISFNARLTSVLELTRHLLADSQFTDKDIQAFFRCFTYLQSICYKEFNQMLDISEIFEIKGD